MVWNVKNERLFPTDPPNSFSISKAGSTLQSRRARSRMERAELSIAASLIYAAANPQGVDFSSPTVMGTASSSSDIYVGVACFFY